MEEQDHFTPFAQTGASHDAVYGRRIVGFEPPSSSSGESTPRAGMQDQNPESSPLIPRMTRQGSLGQQLRTQKQVQPAPPKLNINTRSKKLAKAIRQSSIPILNGTGTLPSSSSGSLHRTGSGRENTTESKLGLQRQPATTWLTRSSTAPEPIPIPEISPAARRIQEKAMSAQPSPSTVPRTDSLALTTTTSTTTTRTTTKHQYLSPAGSLSRLSGGIKELEQAQAVAHAATIQAAALQDALAKEREEVVRLRQELRMMSLDRAASEEQHRQRERNEPPPVAPMSIDNNSNAPTTNTRPRQLNVNTLPPTKKANTSGRVGNVGFKLLDIPPLPTAAPAAAAPSPPHPTPALPHLRVPSNEAVLGPVTPAAAVGEALQPSPPGDMNGDGADAGDLLDDVLSTPFGAELGWNE